MQAAAKGGGLNPTFGDGKQTQNADDLHLVSSLRLRNRRGGDTNPVSHISSTPQQESPLLLFVLSGLLERETQTDSLQSARAKAFTLLAITSEIAS